MKQQRKFEREMAQLKIEFDGVRVGERLPLGDPDEAAAQVRAGDGAAQDRVRRCARRGAAAVRGTPMKQQRKFEREMAQLKIEFDGVRVGERLPLGDPDEAAAQVRAGDGAAQDRVRRCARRGAAAVRGPR